MKRKIVKLISLIIVLLVTISFTNVKAASTLINIDSPSTNQEVTNNLRILGWVMSTTNTNIKAYIDSTEVTDIPRKERQDVLKAIKGYGDLTTNPTPGFDKTVDITTLSYGGHNLKIEVYDSNNKLIKSETRTFIRKAPKTLVNIDIPTINGEYTNTLRMLGWVMSTTNTNIKAYIDNTEITDIPRKERQDVLKAIKGYGDKTTNPTPGFDKNIDLTNFSYGSHNLKIVVYDSKNVLIQTITRSFKRKAPKTITNIDMPAVDGEYTDTVRLLGWVMSTSNNTIKAYIDNTEVTDIPRKERQDVLKAIKGYGDKTTNPTPGFDKTVDIKNLGYGSHNLKIEVYDSKNKLVQTTTRTFQKKMPKTMTNIDMPAVNGEYTDTVRILGWVMSTSNNTIKAYIDNTEVTDIPRKERQDVLKAIKGYGDISTNPTPGFDKTVDITTLGYGSHNLKIEVYDSNNKIVQTTTRTFQKKTPKTLTNIDIPTVNGEYTDTVRILGWVMSTSNNTIKVYIDNTEITNIPRKERQDVLKAINGYGDISTNPTPGFDKTVDITNLSYGTHNLKIDVYDKNNKVIQTTTRTFKRKKSKSDLCIDTPAGTEKIENTVNISGWFLRSNNYTTLKLFIDNKEVNIDTFTYRSDVFSVISGFDKKYNANNGFTTVVNLKSYKYGLHTIKAQLVDNNGVVINEKTRQFTRIKPQSKINIDYPTSTTNRNVRILGWYLAKYDNTKVQILVDGKEITGYSTEKRGDVLNAYPEYKSYMNNSNPGFNGNYDMTSYKDGNHTLTIKIINLDNNEVIGSLNKTFKLKKYKGKIWIDSPYLSNINSNISLIGWEMSESPNSYLKIYVDDYNLNVNINRTERQDVINAIKDYGDASVNPKPGFSATLNTSTWMEGAHTLKIELYSNSNELLTVETKNIFLYKNIFNGIDVSAYNNVYSWSDVRKAGVDYMFARVAVRGYGINNQGIDGNLVADTAFVSHVNGANSVGIKSGAYVFTQATNNIEAVAEANLALQKVYAVGGKSKIQLPIVYDVEFSGCYANGIRCGRADNLDRETRTTIAIAFLETIKSAGYEPMIYASTSFLNNQLNMSRLSNYPVWVAHYVVSQPTYTGPYQVWQYSSSETVPGIYGAVDMNYFYRKF